MTDVAPPSQSPFQKWIRESFSLDLRALAAFRIGLGILILVDLISRSRFLEEHYSDTGILPFSLAVAHYFPQGNISLYGLFSAVGQVQLLFCLQGILAILLSLGVWTRPLTVLNWYFLVSLQQRNPLVLFGGDTLLRTLLFWAIFLPLDAHWSLRPKRRAQSSVLSFGSVAFILQMVILYWFTASGKRGPAWADGTAVSLVLQYESFATPLAVQLRGGLSPDFSYWSSRLVVFFELLGPLLWFSPFAQARVRTASLCAFILMHLIFGTFIVLDIFPLVNFLSLILLFPPVVWTSLFPKRFGNSSEPPPKDSTDRFLQGVCILSFLYVFSWNLARWPGHELKVLPESWEVPANVLWLKQGWTFFEPDPPRDGGWYVMPGKTRGGAAVDVFREQESRVSWVKPEFVSEMMPSDRWVKVYANIWLLTGMKLRGEVARYLCSRWNRHHSGDHALASFEMYYLFYAPTVDDRPGEAIPKTTLVWRGQCQ